MEAVHGRVAPPGRPGGTGGTGAKRQSHQGSDVLPEDFLNGKQFNRCSILDRALGALLSYEHPYSEDATQPGRGLPVARLPSAGSEHRCGQQYLSNSHWQVLDSMEVKAHFKALVTKWDNDCTAFQTRLHTKVDKLSKGENYLAQSPDNLCDLPVAEKGWATGGCDVTVYTATWAAYHQL